MQSTVHMLSITQSSLQKLRRSKCGAKRSGTLLPSKEHSQGKKKRNASKFGLGLFLPWSSDATFTFLYDMNELDLSKGRMEWAKT